MNLGMVGKTLESKLQAAFETISLQVIDESSQHRGHVGARADGESHFRAKIVASASRGKSRVERHRMVNGVLAEELQRRVHALAIEASAPEA